MAWRSAALVPKAVSDSRPLQAYATNYRMFDAFHSARMDGRRVCEDAAR
jgi:hypothetical protein